MNPLECLVVEKARDLIHVVTLNTEPTVEGLTLKERKQLKAVGWATYKKDLIELDEPEMAQKIINGAKAVLVYERET